MGKSLTKAFTLLALATTGMQANAALQEAVYTSPIYWQTADGESFTFTIDNAPLAALADGLFSLHARGDYGLTSTTESIFVQIEDGNSVAVDVLSQDGNLVNAHDTNDLVEWRWQIALSGDDLVSWTQDGQIVVNLDLASVVNANLVAGGLTDQFPPFVQAKLSYFTSAVPVPAAVWLFGSGLLGLFGFTVRKRAI